MANPKTPTRSKIIRGTFRKDRAPENEPKPELVDEIPRPPSHLPAAGKRMWRQLARELIEKRILTVVDLPALEVCCYNYGLFRELDASIRCMQTDPKTGRRRRRTVAEYLAGRNSQTIPEWIQMAKSFSTFKAYLLEFGLTPSSRSRLDVPQGPSDSTDPMERLYRDE